MISRFSRLERLTIAVAFVARLKKLTFALTRKVPYKRKRLLILLSRDFSVPMFKSTVQLQGALKCNISTLPRCSANEISSPENVLSTAPI